jgi:hypothetical protein
MKDPLRSEMVMILSSKNFLDLSAFPTTGLMLKGITSPAGADAWDGARQKRSPETNLNCAVSIIAGIEINRSYPLTTVRFKSSPSSRRGNKTG